MSNMYHETLYPYLYLFITDIAQLPYIKDFSSYEKREPGYAVPFLEAYKHAFQRSKDEPISTELFKSVHATATAHLPQKRSGQYRNETGNFKIYCEMSFDQKNLRRHINPCYSMTEKGMIEFIQYWLLRKEESSKTAYSLAYSPIDLFGN